MIFAEASNQFAGSAFYFIGAGIGIIGGLAALASYFATRREVDSLDKRVSNVEQAAAAIRAEAKHFRRLSAQQATASKNTISARGRIDSLNGQIKVLEESVVDLQQKIDIERPAREKTLDIKGKAERIKIDRENGPRRANQQTDANEKQYRQANPTRHSAATSSPRTDLVENFDEAATQVELAVKTALAAQGKQLQARLAQMARNIADTGSQLEDSQNA